MGELVIVIKTAEGYGGISDKNSRRVGGLVIKTAKIGLSAMFLLGTIASISQAGRFLGYQRVNAGGTVIKTSGPVPGFDISSQYCSVYNESIKAGLRTWLDNPDVGKRIMSYEVKKGCKPLQANIDHLDGVNPDPTVLADTINYIQNCIFFCWFIPKGDKDGGYFNQSVIHYYPTMQKFDEVWQRGVAAHELGHAFGLDHVGYYAGEATGNYSVMDRPHEPNYPTDYDVESFNMLYHD